MILQFLPVLFSRPERKGGKRAGGGPGQKLWDDIAKESRCACEIKNKDELCCARAIVVIREYAKRQAGEQNTFENIKKDHGKNSQQVKEATKLHGEVNIPEGPCGLEEIDSFQDYLGPQGLELSWWMQYSEESCLRAIRFRRQPI